MSSLGITLLILVVLGVGGVALYNFWLMRGQARSLTNMLVDRLDAPDIIHRREPTLPDQPDDQSVSGERTSEAVMPWSEAAPARSEPSFAASGASDEPALPVSAQGLSTPAVISAAQNDGITIDSFSVRDGGLPAPILPDDSTMRSGRSPFESPHSDEIEPTRDAGASAPGAAGAAAEPAAKSEGIDSVESAEPLPGEPSAPAKRAPDERPLAPVDSAAHVQGQSAEGPALRDTASESQNADDLPGPAEQSERTESDADDRWQPSRLGTRNAFNRSLVQTIRRT